MISSFIVLTRCYYLLDCSFAKKNRIAGDILKKSFVENQMVDHAFTAIYQVLLSKYSRICAICRTWLCLG